MDDLKAPTPQPKHLVFLCGNEWYAVPSEYAVEVVTFPTLTPVPGAPPHVLGIFSHRGEIVTVVDLARLTGAGEEDTRRAVLLRLPKGCYALSTRSVAGVLTLNHAYTSQGGKGAGAHLSAAQQEGDRAVAFIEPEGLFDFLSR